MMPIQKSMSAATTMTTIHPMIPMVSQGRAARLKPA
jgi:hypothetical protein